MFSSLAVCVPGASFHGGTFDNAMVHLNKTLPGDSEPWRPRTRGELKDIALAFHSQGMRSQTPFTS
jgi:hypothetical protein